MIPRLIEDRANILLQQYPLLALIGPRQSGKTTFAKRLRPEYQYINLELAENADFAVSDPHGFLQTYQQGVILDEIQTVPELLPYLKHYTDERGIVGEYILTGSQNFLLLEKITQSLAGRVALQQLLPFSYVELKAVNQAISTPENFIFTGGYPRIYDKNIAPMDFYPSYISTYIERDVRQITRVMDLRLFRQFLALCAGRAGQLVNFTEIGNILGIEAKTVKSWLGLLEASFIVFLLPPYYRNFDKRIVKTPKLYFYDTGLACSLLNIQDETQLNTHFAKGALFENMVIVELLKQYLNTGKNPAFYFWQDSNMNEVDLIIQESNRLKAIEIKAGKTLNNSFFKNLALFEKLAQNENPACFLVYGGDLTQKRTTLEVLPWQEASSIINH